MHKRALIFRQSTQWAWVGLIVLVSTMLGFFTLSRGHLWWDDFAGYLMQAKSILSWTMADFIHHNTFTIKNSSYPPGPVAYPWGFPLLIAPVYAIFGLNPLALKLVSLVFYAVFLVCTFFLARARLAELESLLLTAVLAFSPALLAANDLIQSDIPFLAFSTLSLVLIDRFPRDLLHRPDALLGYFSVSLATRGIVIGVAIFMAFFLRTNGILLFAPLLISLYRSKEGWLNFLKKTIFPLLTFVTLVALQASLFPGGQTSYFTHFSLFSPQRLLDNILYYIWLPAWTFDQIPGGAAIYPLMVVFALISLFKRLRRDAAMHAYGLLTVLLFIVWPERQGLRFIYPILPFFFIAAFDGMWMVVHRLKIDWLPRNVAQGLVLGFWGLLMLVCLGTSAYSAYQITAGGREINGPFDQYSKQMYAFIREKTPAESVMIFMRPRALRLFTDRDAFMTERCADLVNGNYVILHQKMEDNGQISPEQVTSCNLALKLEDVYQNKRFIVYKISP